MKLRYRWLAGTAALTVTLVSIAVPITLFDNGPFSGPQRNLRNTAETGITQRVFDDFTVLKTAEITGFEWLQHDRDDIQYLNTEIRIYDGLPTAANLIFTTNIVATRTPNATGTLFDRWEGFDYSVSGLSVSLSAGTYFLGLNTNSLVGDTSWDNTNGSASTIPGRYLVNVNFPEPGLFIANEDSVFKVIGNEFIEVLVDIQPGSESNSVNPRKKGVIPVAILGANDFDATQVDVSTVGFGTNEATPVHAGHLGDVNYDGFIDLIVHFKAAETGIICGDTDATIAGETFGGDPITGGDTIKTVGCR